jgi:preprotein translocase subunit SecA
VRGLHFAIVDEADSVLIDEARTPLILSANVDAEAGATRFRRALDVVGGLLAGRDYRVSETEHRIEMTTAGRQRAISLIAAMEITSDDWIYRVPRASEELIVQALSARYLYRRDKHYIVTDGKVQIVDEYTGLVMADRSWEHGKLAELSHLAMIIVGPIPTGHTGTGTDGACRESPRLGRNRRSDRIDRVGRGRLGATRQVVIGASARPSGD